VEKLAVFNQDKYCGGGNVLLSCGLPRSRSRFNAIGSGDFL